MKKPLFHFSIFNLTLLLFLTLTVGCWGQVESEEQAKSLSDADLLAIGELDQRFVDGMSQMDIEKLMSCFWNQSSTKFSWILMATCIAATKISVRYSNNFLTNSNRSV